MRGSPGHEANEERALSRTGEAIVEGLRKGGKLGVRPTSNGRPGAVDIGYFPRSDVLLNLAGDLS